MTHDLGDHWLAGGSFGYPSTFQIGPIVGTAALIPVCAMVRLLQTCSAGSKNASRRAGILSRLLRQYGLELSRFREPQHDQLVEKFIYFASTWILRIGQQWVGSQVQSQQCARARADTVVEPERRVGRMAA